MKGLKYIYMLLVTMLLGFVITSCDDDDVIGSEKESDVIVYSGVKVKTSFSVGVSAPDVSSDIDVETRSVDNANIDYAQPENGGRFKNIVIVLVDHTQRVLSMHCKEFENVSGVKEYNYVFSDIEIPVEHIGQKQYQVYAFGNVCAEHYSDIVKNDASRDFQNNDVKLSGLNVNGYCVNNTISLNSEKCNNINQQFYYPVSEIPYYCINFKPGFQYILNQGLVTSTGMPENRSAKAVVMKGNTQFNIALKRVCARVKFTFRNLTGQYVDGSGKNVDNDIYIDEFLTTAMLTNSTRYFYDSDNYTYSFPSNNGTRFNILQVLGCRKDQQYTLPTTESDHIHNKIANNETLTISMYVFENDCGDWKYDLKVDRGKSLGKNTTTIQPGNSYVIWNNQAHKSLAIKDNEVCTVDQNSMEDIPFSEQVFWQIESVSGAVSNTYILNNCKYDSNDKATPINQYLPKQNDPDNWGVNIKCKAHGDLGYLCGLSFCWLIGNLTVIVDDNDFQHKFTSTPSDRSSAQYVNFVLGENSDDNQSYFTLNLLKNSRQNYWAEVFGNYRYLFLTTGPNNALKCVRGQGFNKDQTLGEYDWTLYAKYIIKNGEKFSTGTGTSKTPITRIERNHNYEFEFNVMPNYTDEEDLKVRCVRTQNEVSWSEVQK